MRVTGWHCGTLTLRVRPQHTVHCPSHGARPSASPGIVIHDVRTLVPKAAEVRLSFEVVTNDLDQHGVAHRSVVCSHATHSRRHTFVTATAIAAMHSKIYEDIPAETLVVQRHERRWHGTHGSSGGGSHRRTSILRVQPRLSTLDPSARGRGNSKQRIDTAEMAAAWSHRSAHRIGRRPRLP